MKGKGRTLKELEAELGEGLRVSKRGPGRYDAMLAEVKRDDIDVFEVARKWKVTPGYILSLKVGDAQGVEKSDDPIRQKLQSLTRLALGTQEAIMLNPESTDKEKALVARDILDRQSYKGIQRVSVGHKIELSDETVEKLAQAFAGARAAYAQVIETTAVEITAEGEGKW